MRPAESEAPTPTAPFTDEKKFGGSWAPSLPVATTTTTPRATAPAMAWRSPSVMLLPPPREMEMTRAPSATAALIPSSIPIPEQLPLSVSERAGSE